MKVGICGLGLIGGSMAKAYAEAGHSVYGYDLNETTLGFAVLSGTLCGRRRCAIPAPAPRLPGGRRALPVQQAGAVTFPDKCRVTV